MSERAAELIQGTWRLVRWHQGNPGVPVVDDKELLQDQKLTVTFKATKVTLQLALGGEGSEYAYTLDPDKRPKRLTEAPALDRVERGG